MQQTYNLEPIASDIFNNNEIKVDAKNDLVVDENKMNDEYIYCRKFCYHFIKTYFILFSLTLGAFGALYISTIVTPIEQLPYLTTQLFSFFTSV